MKWQACVLSIIITVVANGEGLTLSNLTVTANPTGKATTFDSDVPLNGHLNVKSSFFQSFGENDRTCFSCHSPDGGWTITPASAEALFASSQGMDPLFRKSDGAVSPNFAVGTLDEKRTAFHLLLTKGLIRVELPLPANAEFTLEAVDDPYHYASAAALSLYRRPLSSSNLTFLTDVMWDGRETIAGGDLDTQLSNQANSAVLSHTETTHPLLEDEKQQIVDFEKPIFLAQTVDSLAGDLTEAKGGPQKLADEHFYYGINDAIGKDPTGKVHTPLVFTLFENWERIPNDTPQNQKRLAIARGERLFNQKQIHLKNIGGLSDVVGQSVVEGTCTTCHSVPNVGNQSSSAKMNLGVSDETNRTPDLPLYTFKNKTTGEILKTTDPGRGLITGKWADIGRFKVPTLRGLAARAPYFHNGSADTLGKVVSYLDRKFEIGLTSAEQSDLVAFLGAL